MKSSAWNFKEAGPFICTAAGHLTIGTRKGKRENISEAIAKNNSRSNYFIKGWLFFFFYSLFFFFLKCLSWRLSALLPSSPVVCLICRLHMVQMGEKFIHEKIFILEGDVIGNSIYMYLQGVCKLGTMQRTKCGIPQVLRLFICLECEWCRRVFMTLLPPLPSINISTNFDCSGEGKNYLCANINMLAFYLGWGWALLAVESISTSSYDMDTSLLAVRITKWGPHFLVLGFWEIIKMKCMDRIWTSHSNEA